MHPLAMQGRKPGQMHACGEAFTRCPSPAPGERENADSRFREKPFVWLSWQDSLSGGMTIANAVRNCLSKRRRKNYFVERF
jgi:hypothetical protein